MLANLFFLCFDEALKWNFNEIETAEEIDLTGGNDFVKWEKRDQNKLKWNGRIWW